MKSCYPLMAVLDSYKLELVKKKPEDLVDFANLMRRTVKESDRKSAKSIIKKIQSQYHIDHYFVLKDQRRFGVVKVTRGTFYSLGLPEDITLEEQVKIISMIENNLAGWRINQYNATLHDHFYEAAVELGYNREFSRKKMELEINKAINTSNYEGIISRTYEDGDLSSLIDTFIDAYRDSVDEKIGMFGGGIASSAISSILRGNFGEFRPEMSPLVIADGSDYIEAASLTTISEGCPFVVIIGVRRSIQGQGIGRKLLSWVIDKSRAEGFDKIRLWVTIENEQASGLYESMGFYEISRIHSLVRRL